MAVVVGFVPTNEGRAALRRAAEEARIRSTRLVVISSSRGGKELAPDVIEQHDAELDGVRRELTEAGIDHEVRDMVQGAAGGISGPGSARLR